jgi:hypothetical protein
MWRVAAARAAACVARRARVAALSTSGAAAHTPRGGVAANGPGLADFLPAASAPVGPASWLEGKDGLLHDEAEPAAALRVFMESYGCQMNTNDTEVVLSVLRDAGFARTDSAADADVILLNTCAIREGAEDKIWARLRSLQHLKKRGKRRPQGVPAIGVLGCMAERLKEKLLVRGVA